MRLPESGYLCSPISESDLEEERSAIREKWWNVFQSIEQEGSNSRIDVQKYGLKDWIFAGDETAFSVEISNAEVAEIVAQAEAKKYAVEIDMPCTTWRPEIQDTIFALPWPAQFRDAALVSSWSMRELASQIAQKIGEKYGFESRYWLPSQDTPAKIEERSVVNGAYLLQQLLKEKKWNGIDVLLISSSVLPADISIRILAFAKEKGILPTDCHPQLRDIRAGCAGVAVAFGMMTTDPLLMKTHNAVLLALDPMLDLTGIFPELISFKNIETLIQFGDGFEGWAGDPSAMQLDEASRINIQVENLEIVTTMYDIEVQLGVPEYLDHLFRQSNLDRVTHGKAHAHHLALVLEQCLEPSTNVDQATPVKSKIGDMIKQVFHEAFQARITQKGPISSADEVRIVANVSGDFMKSYFRRLLRGYFHPDYRMDESVIPFSREGAYSSSADVLNNMRKRAKLESETGANRPKMPAKEIFLLATAVGVAVGALWLQSQSHSEK